ARSGATRSRATAARAASTGWRPISHLPELRDEGAARRGSELPQGPREGDAMSRADVRKTYKLYIGGAFPRSESGHSYIVSDAKGRFVAKAALPSHRDRVAH